MTTATAEDTRKKAAPGVAFFASAEPLIRAISNGLLFAGSDDILPALTLIRFEFDGSKLQALSTDRYRLCIETIELDPAVNHNGQPEFAFQLQRTYAKQALAVLKANKHDKISLISRVSASPAVVEFQFYAQTASYPIDTEHGFPAVRSLVPDPSDRIETDEIGFTRSFLADLGKVQTGNRVKYVRIGLYGKHKPTRIDYTDGPTVMLMPVKTENAGDDWGSI